MIEYPPWAWAGFVLFIAALLAVDLGVFNRRAHAAGVGEAAAWCVAWFALAMLFNAFVFARHGAQAGAQWFASYVLELSLSVDNVFVFIMIFTYFMVRPENQHRVLFWGVVGAAVMRAVFILAGIQLIEHFDWVLMIFGAFLILTGGKLALTGSKFASSGRKFALSGGRFALIGGALARLSGEPEVRPEKNLVVRGFMKFFPVAMHYEGARFFTRENGRRAATRLFVVLLVIETTDLVFALDSIPAVLGITKEPFIAFTSNVFAILGLRSLYFVLRGMMGKFRFLKSGIAVILLFIGTKMIVDSWTDEDMLSIGVSLGVIGGVLATSVAASLVFPKERLGRREK